MRIVRWAAAAVTALMSLMNLPFAVDSGDAVIPDPVTWLISLLGVAGIIAVVGLLRHASWGRPAVLAIGAVNLVGAVVALTQEMEGAVIGLAVSALIVVLGFFTAESPTRRRTPSAPKLDRTA